MKTTQRFLTLLFLLGHVSAYAMVPCDGPCATPRPEFKCRKKVNASSVNADTLLVRQNANVCGDLTVNGTIRNLELQLLRDSAVPPTDEVYTEFQTMFFSQPVLENIQDFSFELNAVVPGTEIYPDAPIYGYDTETQALVLNGGPALSYTPELTELNLRYHGQNPDDVIITNAQNVQAWYANAYSYYAQRGFPLLAFDVYPQYEGQYLVKSNPSQGVGIKFVYEDELSSVPTALDLAANADIFVYFSLAQYEANPELRQEGFFYPLRLPITTDINEYKQLYCTEPIAYYDALHRRITIHVPQGSYQLYHLLYELSCCNCDAATDESSNLVAFDGTFNIMRRNGNNQLVSSSFADAQYLIQASSKVVVASEDIFYGESTFLVDEYNFSDEGGVFTGLAIPLMNGGSPADDVFTYNIDDLNANSIGNDPFTLPALMDGNNTLYAQGDNPATSIIEYLGAPVFNNIYDSALWNEISLQLPLNVMLGQTTPEENPLVPLPQIPDPLEKLDAVVGHEMLHNTQSMQGTTLWVPTEAQATGVELDPALNHGIMVNLLRPRFWSEYVSATIRGDWPLTLPEISAPQETLGTYGGSLFWRYLATQLDHNYQAMRRMSDIISHETLNPLLQASGLPFFDIPFGYGFPIGTNPEGSLLALNQALEEIHGVGVQEVFANFAVSLAMLRNNTSIPAEYRHNFPYWLYDSTYPGYEELSVLAPLWETWWQDYQENIILPEGYSFPQYTGQHFVPILDHDITNYPMQDMTMLMFEVPQGTNFVDVHVTGQWRLSMVQFTSDDTPTGEFIMNGQYVNNGGQTFFDVSNFTGTGPIRLVCAHVTLPTYQGLNSFCGEGEYTGTISITRS